MTHDEMIAVIQAAKDGKQIQLRRNSQEPWRNVVSPRFDFDSFDYRAKPEPREWWVCTFQSNGLVNCDKAHPGAFKVREVVE